MTYVFGPDGWVKTRTYTEVSCWVCNGVGTLCDYHADRLSLDESEPEDADDSYA
jgi:hypothetical protein